MTPFLIGLPWSSLDGGGKRPYEDRANFHTNCAPCVGNRAMQSVVSGGISALGSSAGSSFVASSQSGRTWWTSVRWTHSS